MVGGGVLIYGLVLGDVCEGTVVGVDQAVGHWLGGFGVHVFALAVCPFDSVAGGGTIGGQEVGWKRGEGGIVAPEWMSEGEREAMARFQDR